MTGSIFIVDDDDPVRLSLHGLLSEGAKHPIRMFRSGEEFLDSIEAQDSGVVLLDFHMPGTNGLDVLREIRPMSGRFATIMLTGQGDISIAVQAMKAGAVDFLEKPYDPMRLLGVIEQAFAVLAESASSIRRVEAARLRVGKLSPRERDVLTGLIEGRPNKLIAHELSLSPRTVEIYRANMMDKLGVGSLSEALRIAFAAGIVPAG